MGKGIGQVKPSGTWRKCDCPRPGFAELAMDGTLNEIQADPANDVLEQVYKAVHNKNAVLADSDLDKGNFGTMPPKGRLSQEEWRFFRDDFLPQFRGLRNRLRPDIMDFSLKRMYEIKTQGKREEGFHQVVADYRLANHICDNSNSHIHFHRPEARWKPGHRFWMGPNIYICTALTDYNKEHRTDQGMVEDESGLVIYRLFVRLSKMDEEEAKAKALRDYRRRSKGGQRRKKKVRAPVQERIPEIPRDIWIRMQGELDRALGEQDEGEKFVIIAPQAFYHQFVEIPRMNRKIEMLRVHGADTRTNPVMAFRSYNLAIGTISAAIMGAAILCVVVYFAGPLLLAAPPALELAGAASAAGAAEAAVGATVTAEVIFLNSARAVATSKAAQEIAKAAAVLLIVGTVKNADASTAQVEKVLPVLAVPAADFPHEFEEEGVYKGEKYFKIANAYAVG